MHLHGDTLERYAARDLPHATLAAIDTHVSNCLACAHALADEHALSTTWERRGWLGRLVRVEALRPLAADTERQTAAAA